MDPEKQDEEIVTLDEFLEEADAAENEISCVISASDPNNCSYDQGYIPRQAIFVCQTCVEPSEGSKSQPAGVCLACSLSCHEGHEQLVLYTKRRFRCDCGNSKFPESSKCRLRGVKESQNEQNIYGQNFDGLYCTCHRPYPDPEDDVEDEMVQCCVCEDWYHCRHLQPPMDNSEDHYEFICQVCVGKHPFLLRLQDSSNSSEEIDQKADSVNGDQSPPCKRSRSAVCLSSGTTSNTEPRCIILKEEGWRGDMCQCDGCKMLLSNSGLTFLHDEEDSVGRYEAKGREKKQEVESTTERKVVEMWNNMGRVRQVEFGSRLHSFRSQLQDFLTEYQKDGKVVTKEAVGEFFKTLMSQEAEPYVAERCSFK